MDDQRSHKTRRSFCGLGIASYLTTALSDAADVAFEWIRPSSVTDNGFAEQIRSRVGMKFSSRELSVLNRYIQAYPGLIRGVKIKRDGTSFLLVAARGEKGEWTVLNDTIENKDHETKLNSSDLIETLGDAYPVGLPFKEWPKNLDPGRYRNTDFFKAVYGASAGSVRANLVTVKFMGQLMSFNKRNGAAGAFERVGQKLDVLVGENPELKPYFTKMGGSFNWRNISGTDRLSAHSFGMTIDLNPALGGYWKWGDRSDLESMERRNRYPREIVEVFESERMIWGGKWYHYDLMHFEYRPELFGAASPPVQIPRKDGIEPIVVPESPVKPSPTPPGKRLFKKLFGK